MAWAVAGAALVLAVGGAWLRSRSTDAPRLAALPAAPPTALPPQARGASASPSVALQTGASAAVAPWPASAASTPGMAPSIIASNIKVPSLDGGLRKVQLALGGHAAPKEMLEAAEMLLACQSLDAHLADMDKRRDRQDPNLQGFERRAGWSREQAIRNQQDLQRRCQVFDAATLARRGELLKGAYEGGVKDAALPYLLWHIERKQDMSPELRGQLQRDARQAAEDGDYMALAQLGMPFSTSVYGTSEVQRQAYREANLRIGAEMFGAEFEKESRASSDEFEKRMAQVPGLPPPPPLSPQAQREADALAEKGVDAWRKRQHKGG